MLKHNFTSHNETEHTHFKCLRLCLSLSLTPLLLLLLLDLDDLGARSDVQKATNDGQVLQRLDHLVRWRRDGVVDVNVEARGDEGKAEGQQHAEERAANAKNDEQGEGNEDRAGNLHKQNKVRIRQSVRHTDQLRCGIENNTKAAVLEVHGLGIRCRDLRISSHQKHSKEAEQTNLTEH